MNKIQSAKSLRWLYLAAGAIPFAILVFAFFLLECIPFGENNVLFVDASYQYVQFASYLRTIFSGENNVFYSFSKNLGGEMLSLLSYYLVSPFSLLFALATDDTMPLIFTLVSVLKLSACGVTFFWAASRRFGLRPCWLIFSTAYALMGYNAMYIWNIMWLDGVMVLPLLALGLERLWEGKSPALYGFSLAYGLLTNFYIGYMLCITSVLFSLALVFRQKGALRAKTACFGRFVLASCLGGFSSSFVWLPTFLSLLSGRASAANTGFTFAATFNILGLAGKLVPGVTGYDQLCFGTPHIYIGIFAFFLVLCFFLNGSASVRSRLIPLGVMAVLVVSFLFRGLDMVWHGFSPNNAFNFRYSFVLSYVMLTVALYAWEDRVEIKKWVFWAAAGLLWGMCLGLLGMKQLMNLDFLSLPGLAIGAAAAGVTALYLLLEGKGNRFLAALFAVACLAELGANFYLSTRGILGTAREMSPAAFREFCHQLRPALEYVEETDPDFYRLEKNYLDTGNDPMFFGYNGLSHFSSSQQKRDLRFLKAMGLTVDKDIWCHYRRGSTAAVDALLGVRYLLSETELPENKDYSHIAQVGEIQIYRNPYALPIAMVSSHGVFRVDMEREDHFAVQNDIWAGISGQDTPLLNSAQGVNVTLDNLYTMPGEDGATLYLRANPELPGAIRYEIPIARAEPLYFYLNAPSPQQADIRINGKDDGEYFAMMRWDMSYAGTYEIGDTVTIEIVPRGEELQMTDALFYYEDLTALAVHSGEVNSRQVTVQRQSSSHLTGSCRVEEDQLVLFTIPYDTGWKVSVDGKPAESVMVLDALLGIPVEAGEHTFELHYLPRGLTVGLGLSAAAISAAGIWWLLRRRNRI